MSLLAHIKTQEAYFDEALPALRQTIGAVPREVFASRLFDGITDAFDAGQLGVLVVVATMRLLDEEAIHEKTYSNFEEFAEGAVETRVDLEAERQRYRLAWTSARRRAKGRGENFRKMLALAAERLLALDEAAEVIEELRRDVELYREAEDRLRDTMMLLSGQRDEALRERDEAYEALHMANRQRLKMLQQHTGLIDALKATRAERDEARAEVVRLGRSLDHVTAAGKFWLDEGFPNTGATAEHRLASAIEDVITNRDPGGA